MSVYLYLFVCVYDIGQCFKEEAVLCLSITTSLSLSMILVRLVACCSLDIHSGYREEGRELTYHEILE